MDRGTINTFDYLTPKEQAIVTAVIFALYERQKEHELVTKELMKQLSNYGRWVAGHSVLGITRKGRADRKQK